MIRKRIKSISLGEIERTKLKKVYNRMNAARREEIDARIWITRVENFYAKKKDIIALLAIHYIIDLESYCRELFNDSTKRTQCLRGLLIKRKKRHNETRREYNKYLVKRKEKTELKLEKSKERLLGEIEWILIHRGNVQGKALIGTRVVREFDGQHVGGVVTKFYPPDEPGHDAMWGVEHDDGDFEDITESELMKAIVTTKPRRPAGAAAPSQTSFKPFPVETAEPGKIYLPKDLDKDASKEHQRFCENCKMRKDAHIQTKECLRCPEMPFSLGAPAARLSETHRSLFKGGRKITHRKKRRKTNPKKSRKRI